MELGQRIKQARLEAGLSQRQLCGEEITRNMLSQIENGSARPSMDTLSYFAGRLGKPISYFLEEQAVTSPNQPIMEQARQAFTDQQWSDALGLLEGYRQPDPVFDRERWLLEALCLLELGQQALKEERNAYALEVLDKAAKAGENTPYYTPELERRRQLLLFRADPAKAAERSLPDWLEEILLRGKAALDAGDPARCGAILDAAGETDNGQWNFLRAEAYFALGQYARAAEYFHRAESQYPKQTAPRLEQCYRELEDFKQAYFYACKQR